MFVVLLFSYFIKVRIAVFFCFSIHNCIGEIDISNVYLYDTDGLEMLFEVLGIYYCMFMLKGINFEFCIKK